VTPPTAPLSALADTAINHAGTRVAVLFTATAAVATPFATGSRPSGPGLIAVMLGFAVCVAVSVRATMYRLDRASGATLIACLAGATCVASLSALAGDLRPGPAGIMINWATAGTAGGLAFTRGAWWGTAAVLAGLGPALTVAWAGGLTYPHDVIVGPLTYLIGASVVRLAALRGFAATEQALRSAEEAERAVQVAEERWDAAREDQRRLHDTVLATLTLLAHRGRGVAPEAVLQACARDVEILRTGRLDAGLVPPVRTGSGAPLAGPSPSPTVEGEDGVRLEAVVLARSTQAELAGLDVRVHLPDRHPAPRLAAPVAEAIGAALGECLENVRRHAGVAAADVTVVLEDDVVSLIVVDEGVGFDPAAVPVDRMGLRSSVQERIRAVGGQATVWSGTGRGTSVLLTVPLGDPRDGTAGEPLTVSLPIGPGAPGRPTDAAGSR